MALPFSLRSRITFEDTPQDIDGDGDAHGVLVFKGYYDGTSPAYIKGDPLLLLNVMSDVGQRASVGSVSRRWRSATFDKTECGLYKAAIEDLYWKSLNPRQVDLCRNEAGELFVGDPDNAQQTTAIQRDTVDAN